VDTNTTPTPKIRWEPFWTYGRKPWQGYINDYWAGYLDGEEGANHSYSIRQICKGGGLAYKLSGPNLKKSLVCLGLESAKAFAEKLEGLINETSKD